MTQGYNSLIAYIDGAARGNPGPASIGVAIYSETRKPVKEIYKFLGSRTNNQAEYIALQEALASLKELGAKYVTIYSDSQLVVRQMTGEYEVKDKELQLLYYGVKKIAGTFSSFKIIHIPREQNKEADRLANRAIDEALSQGKTVSTIERRQKQDMCELSRDENILISLPNKISMKPLVLEMLKLLKHSFSISREEIDTAKDKIEVSMFVSNSTNDKLEIRLEHDNGQTNILINKA